MGTCISGCIRFWTRVHDESIRKQQNDTFSDAAHVKLSAAEKVPSVLLVFSIIERQSNEDKLINFLHQVFLKDPSLVNQRNSCGETIVFFTCKQGKQKVVNYLLKSWCQENEICIKGSAIHACLHAMHLGNMSDEHGCQMINMLLDKGCDIEACDEKNWTAFYLAASLSCFAGLKTLADRGCDVNQTENDGMTSLHLAVISCNLQAVDFLLNLEDTNPNAEDNQHRTPLHVGLMSALRPNYLAQTWYQPRRYGMEWDINMVACRIAAIERLLLAGACPNVVHQDMKFKVQPCMEFPGYGHISAMRTPLHLALCFVEQVQDNCKTVYRLVQQMDTNLSQENTLQDLDTANTIDKLSSAVVIQLLLFGAYWNREADSLSDNQWLKKYRDIAVPLSEGNEFQNHVCRLQCLQNLCRTQIRVCLALGKGLQFITKLPLPPDILHYIEFV